MSDYRDVIATLEGRDYLKELDFTVDEYTALLELSQEVKKAHKEGRDAQKHVGKAIALVFEKTSTRTRCAFERAAYDLGLGHIYLDPTGSQLGHKESISDTGHVLASMFDGIEYRGFSQKSMEVLAEAASVPVWNGLSDEWHPTQSLCDMLTMVEHAGGKPANEITFAYLGDTEDNVANSLLIAGAMCGMDVRLVGPKERWTPEAITKAGNEIAAATGGSITHTEDVGEGVKNADFIYTDVWLSMGEAKDLWGERIKLLLPYQVNAEVMAATGKPDTKFLHCLPAFHDRNTTVGEQIYEETGLSALEVTDEVFQSDASIVFAQAENRWHSIKAIVAATLGLV
ncbi:ornithine carbamoyltransferase [Gordonia sp. NPDC003429]